MRVPKQVVKGGFGARRSKYLRQADPTFAGCLFVCFPCAKSDTSELTEEPPPSADANGFNSEKNGYKVRIFLSCHSTDENTNIAGKQRQAQWAAQDAFGLNI